MRKLFLVMTLILFSILGFCFADEPMMPPGTYKQYSKSENFYLIVDFENNEICCYENNGKQNEPLWKIPGWYDFVYLSDDGTYCLIFENGVGNLLDVNYKKKDILFTVYKNGIKYDEKRICDVIKNFGKLKRTVSHYYWGMLKNFYEKGIVFNTVEGLKIYNYEAQKILPPMDERNFVDWKEEDLLNKSLSLKSEEGVIENYFEFTKADCFNSVAAVIGKTVVTKKIQNDGTVVKEKESIVTAPELFWRITDGVLEICIDELFGKNSVKLNKLFVDENNLYAIKNKKLVIFDYENILK